MSQTRITSTLPSLSIHHTRAGNGDYGERRTHSNFPSRLACCTCASRWLLSVAEVPCADFLAVVVGAGGATLDWESDIRVSSEAKPGMRMLWLRSRCNCRSLTSRESLPRCLASRHPKLVTESMNSSAICRSRSSTSGSMRTLGSTLNTTSWIERRML